MLFHLTVQGSGLSWQQRQGSRTVKHLVTLSPWLGSRVMKRVKWVCVLLAFSFLSSSRPRRRRWCHKLLVRVFPSELMEDEQFINIPRVETILSRVCLKSLWYLIPDPVKLTMNVSYHKAIFSCPETFVNDWVFSLCISHVRLITGLLYTFFLKRW